MIQREGRQSLAGVGILLFAFQEQPRKAFVEEAMAKQQEEKQPLAGVEILLFAFQEQPQKAFVEEAMAMLLGQLRWMGQPEATSTLSLLVAPNPNRHRHRPQSHPRSPHHLTNWVTTPVSTLQFRG